MEYIAARHTTPITREEERELAIRAKAGDKAAQDRLILSQYRFAVKVAHKYYRQGMEISDLVSEATFGLHRAAQTFDPDKGLRFMSYAVWWIRQSITKALRDHGTMIRLPSNYYVNGGKKREKEGGEELVVEHRAAIKRMRSMPSMEAMTDSGLQFRDLGPGTDAEAEANSARKMLNSLLSTLSPRDQKIIRGRYGLDTGEIMDLRRLGEVHGVSHERIRQRLDWAGKKMRVVAKKHFANSR